MIWKFKIILPIVEKYSKMKKFARRNAANLLVIQELEIELKELLRYQ